MSTPPLLPSRYVPRPDIRNIFNTGPYREQMENGQLTPFYLRDAHLTQEERGNHLCTQRQMIRYLDPQGNPVVEVFQYLRADGTLGASGMPDPKRLWLNNEILIAERRSQPRPSREETTPPS